jgi:hypothetical protein
LQFESKSLKPGFGFIVARLEKPGAFKLRVNWIQLVQPHRVQQPAVGRHQHGDHAPVEEPTGLSSSSSSSSCCFFSPFDIFTAAAAVADHHVARPREPALVRTNLAAIESSSASSSSSSPDDDTIAGFPGATFDGATRPRRRVSSLQREHTTRTITAADTVNTAAGVVVTAEIQPRRLLRRHLHRGFIERAERSGRDDALPHPAIGVPRSGSLSHTHD